MKGKILKLLVICFTTAFSALAANISGPETERDVTIAPGVTMKFRWVNLGSFIMGSPEDETSRDPDEGPTRSVEISKGFYLGVYEVTQAEWFAVMGDNPAAFQQGDNPESRPIESVSWNACSEFLNHLDGLGFGNFRFPTEAEWEYACRAGTTTPYYWGEVEEQWQAYPHAWTNSRSFATTHPVGTKPPNPWGFHDMSGNVWEWCADWYGPYPSGRRVDPTGPATGTAKVFRGGSYYDFPHSLRSANRHRHQPDRQYTAIGFRVAWDPVSLDQIQSLQLPLPGGTNLELVKIPAGSFMMGSPKDETGRQGDEGPQQLKTITDPYFMGKYEITQAQWESVMGDNPSTFQRLENAGNHPVERVSWEDAQEFIKRLNQDHNRVRPGSFSLPTEAEWEYACRAGSPSRFPWGNDGGFQQLVSFAWYNSRAEGVSHPVGTKQPNPWGLYDMHGNVWEWCEDTFSRYPESDGEEITPKDMNLKIIRGGSWFNEPEALRSANRHRHSMDSRQTNLGFRVVWKPLILR